MHCSHRENAFLQRFGGNRIGLTGDADLLKISVNNEVSLVQTTLLAAGCNFSGNVPCNMHNNNVTTCDH